MTGDRQMDVEHSANVETEEGQYGGHNARFGDMTGSTQLFASTKEKRNSENRMLLPNGDELRIVHEYGPGSIEGETVSERKQLSGGERKDRGSGSFLDRFRRK